MSARIVASVCAVLLVVLASCDARQNSEDQRNQPPSNAVCLDAQRAEFPGLAHGWRKMALTLTAGNKPVPELQQLWTSAFDKARATVAKAGCPDPPREFEPLTAFTTDLNKSPAELNVDQARRLGRLLSDLRKTLQVSPVDFDERLLELPMTCEEISSQVSATYSARTVATSKGRDLWAVLSVRNKSSRGVYVTVDGQLATNQPLKGSPRQVSWQSTSPAGYAAGFKTSRHALLGPGGERLHVTSNGKVTSLAATVSVGFSAGQSNCPIRASSASERTVRVAVAGDIACDPKSRNYNNGRGVYGFCQQKATASLVKKLKPDAVFALGDLQYQAGSLSNFEQSYDPTWGRFKDITYPVPGDHEYGSPGAEGYFTYFGSRATPQDPDCTAECRAYYSFDLGAWHVAALNVNCGKLPRGDGCGRRSAQNRWLDRDLKAANKATACTVVLMHEPRWSNSHWQSPELNALVKTMYRNGVDLILSGDSHSYERFAPQNPASRLDKTHGIIQIVVGTGGAHFTGLNTPRPNREVSEKHVFGVLKLSLQDGSYTWNFRAHRSTPFKDSGSQDCH
jgi:Calcineurin-like phosphoesterase